MPKMILVPPVDWSCDGLPFLSEQGIKYVYGKRYGDFIGSGVFFHDDSSRLSDSALKAYIKALHVRGMALTYVMDAACLDNQEWTVAGHKRIRSLLDNLVAYGVDAFSISIPYLAELIKRQYPQVDIEVSSVAGVDHVQRARRWEDLGATVITLDPSRVNRDFDLLKDIRRGVECALQLVANQGCPTHCIDRSFCVNAASHGRQGCLHDSEGSDDGFLSSIKPEDVRCYEAAGVGRLQLLNVGRKNDQIQTMIRAYSLGVEDIKDK